MKIEMRGNKAALQVPINSENLKKIRGLPAPYEFSGSTVLFELEPVAMKYIQREFPNIKNGWAARDIEWKNGANTTRYEIEWMPYEHQEEAFKQSYDETCYMWRMGVQTGKSALALWNASFLAHLGKIDAVLIVAPFGVHKKWLTEEFTKFWPDCVPAAAAWWSSTMRAAEKKKFEQARSFDGVQVLSFNIKAFSAASRRAEKLCEAFMRSCRVFFVLDESHMIKTPSAKRTRAIHRLGRLAAFRRALTGTAGQPLDYYSQYNWLDRDILGFSTYTAYKNHFAVSVDLPGKTDRRGHRIKIVAVDHQTGRKKYKNLAQLRNMIEPYTYTRATEDCNDLPPQIYGTIPVDLSKEQRGLYDDICADLIVEFEGNEISAPMAIQKMVRLRQIIGGFLPDADGRSVPINPVNLRIERMMGKIETLEGQIIIWASFRAEIEAIAKRLVEDYGEKDVVLYYGGAKDDVGRERFQRGEARFFVSNPACGGVGFSLYSAHQMIFYSNGYDLKQRLQAEGRILAQAQSAKHCVFLDLVAENTIDEHVRSALLAKYEVESMLTGRTVLEWLR